MRNRRELERFASLSAVVLATLLLSSAITYSLSPQQVFAQEPTVNATQTQQQQQVTETGTAGVDQVTEAEAVEIMDNLAQAEQAVILDNELMALAKLQNIRNIITGGQNLTIVVALPFLSPSTANTTTTPANQTNVMNDTTTTTQNNFAAEGGTTTTTTTTEGTTLQGSGNNDDVNNNNNLAPSPTSTDTTSVDTARIVPVQQQLLQQQPNQETRTFRITFDALHVNADHDPFSEGEWVMDVYVNDQIATLWDGSIPVNNEETVQLTENNQVTVTVPATNGRIMLTTVGWENDVGFEQPPTPILLDALSETMSFDEFTRRAQGIVADSVGGGFQMNDQNGFVEAQFTATENFGIGQHRICSQPNEIAASQLTTFLDQTCDFELVFTIEEVQ
jgi:hypothetical protein